MDKAEIIVGAGANVHEFGRFEIADEFAILCQTHCGK